MMSQKIECLFCKIIQNKEILVYEDQDVVAFMDIKPIAKGHILVIPKQHANTFLDCSSQLVGNVNIVAHQIAKGLLKIIPTIKGFNILTNCGKEAFQEVFHYHVHVIPKYNREQGLKISHSAEVISDKLINDLKLLIKQELK